MNSRHDLIVVGAGMLGLAHAYHAARRGLRVLVVEKDSRSRGASVQNFGMLAKIAQAPGAGLERALRTEQYWRDVATRAGIDLKPCGCLFLATANEEMDVLRAFMETGSALGRDLRLLDREGITACAPPVRGDAVLGGLWSPEAVKIDQRSAMEKLAAWLRRQHGVSFQTGARVQAIEAPELQTTAGGFRADRIVVCAGDDFETLFPEVFAKSGVRRCRLQMMRTVPQPGGWRLDPFILGGLSMARYGSFQHCAGMEKLKQHLADRYPDCLKHGVHVIACQESDGSVTIGDSHHHGETLSPERSEAVDRLILDYLAERMMLADKRIAERWIGHYASLADTDCLMLEPQAGVRLVTMTNGQGMTHGFAVAEETIGLML